MCIVTGPNIDLATKLIKRLKTIFEPKLGLYFRDKETVLNLNGCQIEAYPSNHLDSFRSLTNPKFIFLDEADMFRKGEQEDVRHVSERYIGKSDPYIVMVSTPEKRCMHSFRNTHQKIWELKDPTDYWSASNSVYAELKRILHRWRIKTRSNNQWIIGLTCQNQTIM